MELNAQSYCRPPPHLHTHVGASKASCCGGSTLFCNKPQSPLPLRHTAPGRRTAATGTMAAVACPSVACPSPTTHDVESAGIMFANCSSLRALSPPMRLGRTRAGPGPGLESAVQRAGPGRSGSGKRVADASKKLNTVRRASSIWLQEQGLEN